jgi:hypothetical protein
VAAVEQLGAGASVLRLANVVLGRKVRRSIRIRTKSSPDLERLGS